MRQKSRLKPQYLIYTLLFLVIFTNLFIILGVSKYIRFVMDIILCCLVIFMMLEKKRNNFKSYNKLGIFILSWWGFLVISAMLNNFSFVHVLWASRNWCRGFIFLAACTLFLNKLEYEKIINYLKLIFHINTLLVLYQYFFLHLTRDYLGGIFGTDIGCNSMTNIFFCILTIILVYEVLESKKISAFSYYYFFISMAIVGLEEIKAYFYEYLLIILGIAILFMIKKQLDFRCFAKLLIIVALSYCIGLYCTYLVMPGAFRVLIGAKSYAAYEESSRSAYKISRVHFIKEINEFFFKGDLNKNLIGLGFGNCEYSGASARLTSDFYRQYGDMNYLNCAHHTMYLEGGIIGTVLYVLIFISMFFSGVKKYFEKVALSKENVFLLVFVPITILGFVYNNALRADMQYLIYFALAMGLQCLCDES